MNRNDYYELTMCQERSQIAGFNEMTHKEETMMIILMTMIMIVIMIFRMIIIIRMITKIQL